MKCDKLNAYNGDIYIPVYGSIADAEVYLKSEVDKVIADLEESHKKEVERLLMEIVEMKKACNSKDEWCLHTLKENRHHKYKRCLAMALLALEKRESYKAEYEEWCLKWYKRWLELAEQFKGGR